MTLGVFIPQHLALRRQEATVIELWLKETGARLQAGAIHFFGADRPLLSITSREVLRLKIWLTEFPNGRVAPSLDRHSASTWRHSAGFSTPRSASASITGRTQSTAL